MTMMAQIGDYVANWETTPGVQGFTFLSNHQGVPVLLTLGPRSIYLSYDESARGLNDFLEEESPFSGSMRVYFDPARITTHPYHSSGVPSQIEESVTRLLQRYFGYPESAVVSYSESGRQGMNFIDFDISSPESLYQNLANPERRVYITLDGSTYWNVLHPQ